MGRNKLDASCEHGTPQGECDICRQAGAMMSAGIDAVFSELKVTDGHKQVEALLGAGIARMLAMGYERQDVLEVAGLYHDAIKGQMEK